LVAVGGDLGVERLLLAYEMGIFPWFDEGMPPLWWSPDPRAVMDLEHLHISRSLRRRLRCCAFTLTLNSAFTRVMRACGARPEGTWVTDDMVAAYSRLHALGHAHSVEVWMDGELAGGLYGVQRGGFFAAESMFHRMTDASKIALVAAISTLFAAGIELFDVQFLTPHLESLGAYELARDAYLDRLGFARRRTARLEGLQPRVPASTP
jgi:leucyl/phenylalanyl-tRNA--protein transferase